MSKSYKRNIERLRTNQSNISQQEQKITTAAAKERGEYEIAHARDITNKLTPFSKALQDWKDKDIEKQIEEGRRELEKAELENAQWLEKHGTETQKQIRAIEDAKKMGELAFEFADAKAQDVELQRLKGELLKRDGTVRYPDADRLAQLSPWQQVGFAQQDIKNKKNMLSDMLAHSMQNGEENITLGGITYSAKEISGNKLAYHMKEHAVNIYADKIFRNLGLDKYSKEMLKRGKVYDALNKAKEAEIAKHRKMYNIESSMNTQKKATLQWEESEKTGKDIEHFLLTWGNTVDTKGNLYGHTGALNQLFSIMVKEGVNSGGDPAVLEKYKDLPIPEGLRQRLGAKAGATFGSHWPKRFEAARTGIVNGRDAVVDQMIKEQALKKKEITVRFDAAVEAARKEGKTLTKQEEEFWIKQYQAIGEQPPEKVKSYTTASERRYEDDKEAIERSILLNGYITHDQLDGMHPLAAGEFRDKADEFQKDVLEDTGADAIIKGALDNTFANMGVKNKEKSMAYQIASQNAKEDFHKQYAQYRRWGIPHKLAAHMAVHGPDNSKIPPEQQDLFAGRLGVAQEITQNGEASKYTKAGMHIENTVGDELKRVRYAMNAAKEMRAGEQRGLLLRKTQVLGGDYGQQQLDAIKKNIKDYGLYRGMAMSEEHVKFYKAIMAGRSIREGDYWGLIHDQLIADDPTSKGLNDHTVVQTILPLLTKKPIVQSEEGEEEVNEDPDGATKVSDAGINAANNGGALLAYNYITDADNYYNNKSRGSIFDQPDQIPAHLGGVA